jgi:hypothetical protein
VAGAVLRARQPSSQQIPIDVEPAPLLAHEPAAFVQALPATGETGASDEFDFRVVGVDGAREPFTRASLFLRLT